MATTEPTHRRRSMTHIVKSTTTAIAPPVVSHHAEAVEESLRRIVKGEFYLLPQFAHQFLEYLSEGSSDLTNQAVFCHQVGLKGAHVLYVLQDIVRGEEAASCAPPPLTDGASADVSAAVSVDEPPTTPDAHAAPSYAFEATKQLGSVALGLAASHNLYARTLAMAWCVSRASYLTRRIPARLLDAVAIAVCAYGIECAWTTALAHCMLYVLCRWW